MSDTLLGVIIGGLIATGTSLIPIFFEYKKWKKEKKIENLKLKRKEFEILFTQTQKALSNALQKDAYPVTMLCDIEYLLPKEVLDRFNKMILEKDRRLIKMQSHYYDICRLMKKSISDIDTKIEKEI